MAIYKLFPTKDASLYSEFPTQNTGMDEILEASTYIKLGTPQTSRYLVEFSTPEITDVINNKISGSSYTTYLRNLSANVTGLNTDSVLKFHQISGSWVMGTGKSSDSPIQTTGTSWLWKDEINSIPWVNTGSDYYTTPSSSQTFNYSDITDIKVDVKEMVEDWYSGSIPNNGFLVKQQDGDEFSSLTSKATTFKYFSIDTNTIYPPQLEFRWDDHIFNTGSSTNTILNKAESFISVYNNAGEYYPSSIEKFRFSALPKYPDRQFITGSYYTQNYYLPESTSLYAIKDSETNEYVIDFDPLYTKISADSVSSYFNIYMDGLEPERYYTILVKTVLDGVTKVFDEDIMFKIING
tara:strand:+ start:277 stop:1332 length:1056 start_codon:yes stop_codon:yes gene_type:complete